MALEDPSEIATAFADAWMARDAAALARLFRQDADFVNVVGLWWEDRAGIEKAHDYALKSFFSESRLAIGRTKVRRVGDDAAVVHARLTLTGQIGPDGAPSGRRATILTFVMARDAEGWLCVTAQNTDIVPGAETFTSDGTVVIPTDYRRDTDR